MTHAYSIDRVSSSAADVAVEQLTQSDFDFLGTVKDLKSGVSISTWTIPTGDDLYPTIITVKTEKSPTKVTDSRRSVISMSTWARDVDGDGEVVNIQPITIAITIVTPGLTLEVGDLSDLVANAFGLTFNTLTTKVPDTTVLGKLLFGSTEVF